MVSRARHDDSGFTLVEVMVSALLVVLVSIGVLRTIDSASATSGRERVRTQAASLANREAARFKAMSPANLQTLAGTTQTRQLTVDRHVYDLSTDVSWASDQTGDDVVCTGAASPQYIRLVTSVTNTKLAGTTAPSVTNYVSSPAGTSGGVLRVSVKDNLNAAVPNATVNLTGTAVRSAPTNANGCATFAQLPKGPYDATVSKSGFVDPNGVTSPVQTGQNVFDGQVTDLTFNYALGAKVNLTFFTTFGSGNVASNVDRIKAQGGSISGSRYFGAARTGGLGTFVPALSTTDAAGTPTATPTLYPSASAFSVSVGDSCSAEEWWYSVGALAAGATPNVNYPVPGITVTTQQSGTPTGNATVSFWRKSGDCPVRTQTYTSDPTTKKVSVGLTPGNWQVCVQYGTSWKNFNPPNLAKPTGISTAPSVLNYTADVPTGQSGSSC